MKAIGWIMACVWLAMPVSAACRDCTGGEAAADATSWAGDAEAPTRIILSNPSHNYGGPIWAALEIDIADGWFVYAASARNAAGPILRWTGSTNLAPVAMHWPRPEIILLDGNPTPVYRGHVVLPISVGPIDAGRDIDFALTLTYAVCGDVCRPGQAIHQIRISAAPIPPSDAAARNAAAIAEALRKADGG